MPHSKAKIQPAIERFLILSLELKQACHSTEPEALTQLLDQRQEALDSIEGENLSPEEVEALRTAQQAEHEARAVLAQRRSELVQGLIKRQREKVGQLEYAKPRLDRAYDLAG